MKLKLILSIFILGISFNTYSQDYSLLAGARSEGMAHATVSILDAFSTSHNPSLLSWNEENFVGISGRNNFSINAYHTGFATGAFTAGNNGNAGFNFQYNGTSSYNQFRVGGYYAMNFGKVFAASVGMNLYQYRLKGYDASFGFTPDLGLTAKVEKAVFGVFWGNMTDNKYGGTYNEEIPSFIRFGGSYYFQENFILALEGVQDLGADIGFRGGLEYIIEEVVGIRAGYSSLPEQTSFGASIYLKDFSFDFAGSWHPMLGFTPHIGATYTW